MDKERENVRLNVMSVIKSMTEYFCNEVYSLEQSDFEVKYRYMRINTDNVLVAIDKILDGHTQITSDINNHTQYKNTISLIQKSVYSPYKSAECVNITTFGSNDNRSDLYENDQVYVSKKIIEIPSDQKPIIPFNNCRIMVELMFRVNKIGRNIIKIPLYENIGSNMILKILSYVIDAFRDNAESIYITTRKFNAEDWPNRDRISNLITELFNDKEYSIDDIVDDIMKDKSIQNIDETIQKINNASSLKDIVDIISSNEIKIGLKPELSLTDKEDTDDEITIIGIDKDNHNNIKMSTTAIKNQGDIHDMISGLLKDFMNDKKSTQSSTLFKGGINSNRIQSLSTNSKFDNENVNPFDIIHDSIFELMQLISSYTPLHPTNFKSISNSIHDYFDLTPSQRGKQTLYNFANNDLEGCIALFGYVNDSDAKSHMVYMIKMIGSKATIHPVNPLSSINFVSNIIDDSEEFPQFVYGNARKGASLELSKGLRSLLKGNSETPKLTPNDALKIFEAAFNYLYALYINRITESPAEKFIDDLSFNTLLSTFEEFKFFTEGELDLLINFMEKRKSAENNYFRPINKANHNSFGYPRLSMDYQLDDSTLFVVFPSYDVYSEVDGELYYDPVSSNSMFNMDQVFRIRTATGEVICKNKEYMINYSWEDDLLKILKYIKTIKGWREEHDGIIKEISDKGGKKCKRKAGK